MPPDVWPLPKFHFMVHFGTITASFQEVSGLDIESQVIEYRAENALGFSKIKIPGLLNNGNVTMKKGVFIKGNNFFDWYKAIKLDTIQRQSVEISLLDEAGKPVMVWTLTNAWPTKITGTALTADGDEVAIESIELAHEGLTISNQPGS